MGTQRTKLTHEAAELRLKAKGLRLLSPYEGMSCYYKIGCSTCGHEWEAQACHVFYGRGCPVCGRARVKEKLKLSDAELQKRVSCLGLEIVGPYTNFVSPCQFRCKNGHVWSTTASSVLHLKTGCPVCAGQRPDPDDIQRRLGSRGILLLDTYKGAQLLHDFRCGSCGYEWTTTADSVLRGSGCLPCSYTERGVRHRVPVEDVKNRLASRHIELIGEYKGEQAPTSLRCTSCLHEWVGTPLTVCRGCFTKWGVSEAAALAAATFVTGLAFTKHARPKWLHGLELDAYNEEHQLAFEYQGVQHYKPIEFWGGLPSLISQKKRDNRKRMACARHHVLLIRIPYWIEDLNGFIRKKLHKAGKQLLVDST